jgi:hypothetical protein
MHEFSVLRQKNRAGCRDELLSGYVPGFVVGGDGAALYDLGRRFPRDLCSSECDQAICFRSVTRRCWMRLSRVVPR